MRTVTLALLLLCSCSKLDITQPAPHLERSAQNLRQLDIGDPAHLIRQASARVQGDELVMVLLSPLSFDSLGTGFDVQAMFDTDQNPETYPYSERVARVLEREGDTFPIRTSTVDETDPGAPGAGGWGEITGYGEMDESKHRLALHIPLSALGDDGVLDWRLEVYRGLDASAARGSTQP